MPLFGDGGKESRDKQEKAITQNAINSFSAGYGSLGSTSNVWNPITQQIETKATFGKPIEDLYNTSLGKISNFDTLAGNEENRVNSLYQDPLRRQMQAQMGNYFAGMGRSGRNSSRGIDAFSRTGQELSDLYATKKYELGQQARRNLQGEIGWQNQSAWTPMSAIMGSADRYAGQLASARQETSRQLSDMYDKQAQADAQKGSEFGQLVGGVVGLGSQFIPIPKLGG